MLWDERLKSAMWTNFKLLFEHWRNYHVGNRWVFKQFPTERLHFHFHFHALEKEMATHSSVLAWRIPGTGEPGGLPSLGLYRVGHDWSDVAAAAAAMK